MWHGTRRDHNQSQGRAAEVNATRWRVNHDHPRRCLVCSQWHLVRLWRLVTHVPKVARKVASRLYVTRLRMLMGPTLSLPACIRYYMVTHGRISLNAAPTAMKAARVVGLQGKLCVAFAVHIIRRPLGFSACCTPPAAHTQQLHRNRALRNTCMAGPTCCKP